VFRPRAARGVALAAASLLACARPPRPPAPSPAAAAPAPAGAPGCSYGAEREHAASPLEREILARAVARLEAGGARPSASPALGEAARALARAAADGAPQPLARARVRAALARACAPDPAPAAVLAEAPAPALAAALAAALPRTRATHVGAGVVERGGVATAVVLLSERGAQLDRFPRDVAAGARITLGGALVSRLSRPRVFVAAPGRRVVEAQVRGSRRFEARLSFPDPGRYAVEVLGEGEGGPEVAALLTVSAGGAALDEATTAPSPEPPDDAAAEAWVLAAVNATRRGQGLPPLARAADLDAVARAHSAAMASAGTVAHVLPGSGDLGDRLRRARVPYRRAFENVARAATALGAHEAAEESPAHLANVLRPEARRAGVGIARAPLPSGGVAVYLTEVFLEPPDDGADSPLTPEARVREALWRERARRGLPPLTADAPLDAIARDAALALRAADAAEPPGDAGARALALRRDLAAVDVFVASAPDEATRSANLADARLRRVGVGVATGDSRRFGAGRFWIAVVYTD
jgi:uncharacterized protein YkwD